MKWLALGVATMVTCASTALSQAAAISGQVVPRDGGQPLGYAAVSILSDGRQLLTNESGKFLLLNVVPGDVRLRFKRIGFVPKDTTVRVAPGDTARITIAMARLVIQLPAMLVSGKCTNETPRAARSEMLTDLFDQVNQNAERVRLLSTQTPFVLFVHRVRGFRNATNAIVATSIDTVVRHPLPLRPYVPKHVLRPDGLGSLVLALPELPDIADTAFINHHCLTYAGQTRWESDSVIQVDFEPVPWLNKEVDIKGSFYLKVDGYQLVGSITSLNKIPTTVRRGGVDSVSVRAKFTEIVAGVPVLDEWELRNHYMKGKEARIEIGQVFNVKWTDSAGNIVDADTVKRGDTATVHKFAQRFYDMYATLRRQSTVDAMALVLSSDPPMLSPGLTNLLRDDAAARRVTPGPTRELLAFDPFLSSENPCPRYRVGSVRARGDSAAASVHAVCPLAGPDSVSKRPTIEVLFVRRSGRWEIIDFEGPAGSLVKLLCGYAMADKESARRPQTCG